MRQRKGTEKLWRWWLSLVLCLIAALALGLALTRAGVSGAVSGARLVLVLDNSPSMAARTSDGATRWAHALTQARALLATESVHAMVLDTMGIAPLSGFVSPSEARLLLERLQVATTGTAQMPVLPSDNGYALHVIGDGVAAIDIPASAAVHSMFEPADNVAVTALDVRAFPADPLRLEAFVQLFNASPAAKHTRLALRGTDGFRIEQGFDLAPGELIDASFDVSGFAGGVLAAAALTPGDALALDDIAFAIVPEHRVRHVVLVTRGNPRLEDCLRSLPGVRVTSITPGQYRADMKADAYVFDGFAPAHAPQVSALLFHPPAVDWLPAHTRESNRLSVADWERGDALTDGVAWRDLRVRRASLSAAAPAVVARGGGTLIARGRASAAWVAVGFSPQESNFTTQTGFPVFVGNALDWLVNGEPPMVRGIGTVHAALTHAIVSDGSGARVPSRNTPEGTVFDALRPDVYTLRAQAGTLKVVANLLDPRIADINHSRFADRAPAAVGVAALKRRPAELWWVLSGLAFALLLIEWVAYTRRITL
jgi:hypothetical protein